MLIIILTPASTTDRRQDGKQWHVHVVSLWNIGTVLLLMNVTFSSYRPVVSLMFVFKLDTFKEGVAHTGTRIAQFKVQHLSSSIYNICPLRYRFCWLLCHKWLEKRDNYSSIHNRLVFYLFRHTSRDRCIFMSVCLQLFFVHLLFSLFLFSVKVNSKS